MPSPKQLVISTLKDLNRSCLGHQMRLATLRAARRGIEAQERTALQHIHTTKARLNRELLASGSLLGIKRAERDDEDDDRDAS